MAFCYLQWVKDQGRQEARRELLISFGLFAMYLLNKRWMLFYGVLPHLFAMNHLNDLIAGALFPSYVNLLLILSGLSHRVEGIGHILFMESMCSLMWEVAAPLYISGSTGDLLDVLSYFAGGLCYLLIRRAVSSFGRLS